MSVELALAILGVVLATAALLLPILIERKRRPVLRITAGEWSNDEVPWIFAAIRIVNEPLRGLWGRVLSRQSAEGCIVSFTISPVGSENPLIENLPGRWSGTPEPYRTDVQTDPAGNPISIEMFDHRLVPDSFRFDVPATGVAEEVAVAVLRDGKAHAFNSYSYAHPAWANPEWHLPAGTYEVVARAESQGVGTSAEFVLVVTATALKLHRNDG